MKETSITYKKMKKSKQTKSNEQFKILRMIARDFEQIGRASCRERV